MLYHLFSLFNSLGSKKAFDAKMFDLKTINTEQPGGTSKASIHINL